MGKNGRIKWTRLDNAAKIFPCTTSGRDPKVFRVSCELYQDIDEKILQYALDQTMERFPFYRCALKRGIFWYYFESNDLIPKVEKEGKHPCSAIYDRDRKGLLFEVSYYRKRINLEIYHALSDGTGAVSFLKTLVMFYITRKYSGEFKNGESMADVEQTDCRLENDSFFKYYSREKVAIKGIRSNAYKIRGDRFGDNKLGVIEGVMSTSQLINKSRELGVTVTALLSTALICSIHEEMPLRYEHKTILIDVPVNLRKYFKSETARNFFALVQVGYNFKGSDGSFDAVLASVSAQLKERLTEEHLKMRMNTLSAIENLFAARIVPLFIKDPCMNIASRIAERGVTAAFSNVGKISVPEPFEKYIRLFDVMSSTPRMQICACSFLDNFVVSITSQFSNIDIQRNFFRMLSKMGLNIEISSNITD